MGCNSYIVYRFGCKYQIKAESLQSANLDCLKVCCGGVQSQNDENDVSVPIYVYGPNCMYAVFSWRRKGITTLTL